jgi:hypothetical protein
MVDLEIILDLCLFSHNYCLNQIIHPEFQINKEEIKTKPKNYAYKGKYINKIKPFFREFDLSM